MADKATLLRQLAALLAAAPPSQSLAARLAQAAVVLLRVDGVSITIATATPNRVTLAVTDQVAAELEQLQDVLAQGPCWDAYLTATPQQTDLTYPTAAQWPQFGPAAREAVGPRTLVSLPMAPQGSVVGVLSAHLAAGDELPLGLEESLFLSDAIGAALLLDPQQHNQDELAGPWSGRAHVHQATGMVVAQLRVTPADALAILRAHAFAHHASLDEIAEQVLRGSLDFGKDTE